MMWEYEVTLLYEIEDHHMEEEKERGVLHTITSDWADAMTELSDYYSEELVAVNFLYGVEETSVYPFNDFGNAFEIGEVKCQK